MSPCMNGYNFQNELESIWSSFLHDGLIENNSFPITKEDEIISLFEKQIVDSAITSFLGEYYEHGFLVIKFPDRSLKDGIRIFPFLKSQNPYFEIREEYEKKY